MPSISMDCQHYGLTLAADNTLCFLNEGRNDVFWVSPIHLNQGEKYRSNNIQAKMIVFQRYSKLITALESNDKLLA